MCEQGSKMVKVALAHTTKGLKTHAHVDRCISGIIQMFNDNGYQTVASCCGHGVRPGVITLENGTELILCYSYKQTRMIESLYPGLHEDIDGTNPPPMNVDQYAQLVNELEEVNKNLESDNDALIFDRNNLKDRISEVVKELQLQEQDNERITQLSKTAVDTMRNDRDGQKQGWDSAVGVVDKLVDDILDYKKEIEDLKKEYKELEEEKKQYHLAWDNAALKCEGLEKEVQSLGECHVEEHILKEEIRLLSDKDNNWKAVYKIRGEKFKDIQAECDRLRVTISSLRTASKFKKEYDPKWQKDNLRLDRENKELITENNNLKHQVDIIHKEYTDSKEWNNHKTLAVNEMAKEIMELKKDTDRIHRHWHRQTSGYMNKIKNQRRQLKHYQKHSARLTERINTVYPYIVHGDMAHRKWLRKAVDEHFDMSRPDPKPKLTMDIQPWSFKPFKGELFLDHSEDSGDDI